jgi:hypothetical protein
MTSAVLRASGLGWSDLREPSRVLSVLERQGSLAEQMFKSGHRDRRVLGLQTGGERLTKKRVCGLKEIHQ